MRFEVSAYIENLVGKYRSRSHDPAVPRESVRTQRMPRSCYNLFLRTALLGSVYCVLTSTVMAQEPVGKAGEAQKLTAPPKKSSPRHPQR